MMLLKAVMTYVKCALFPNQTWIPNYCCKTTTARCSSDLKNLHSTKKRSSIPGLDVLYSHSIGYMATMGSVDARVEQIPTPSRIPVMHT